MAIPKPDTYGRWVSLRAESIMEQDKGVNEREARAMAEADWIAAHKNTFIAEEYK